MRKINIKNLIENIAIILASIVFFANANIFSPYVGIILWAIFCLSILYIVMYNKKEKVNEKMQVWGLAIIYLILNMIFSYNIEKSFELLRIYVFFYTFLTINRSEKSINTFFKYIKNIVLFGALTIIISPMITDFISRFFSFFVKASPIRQMAELQEHTYSGIFSEKANAAFILNVGIAIVGSNLLFKNEKKPKEKKKNIIELIILFVALILTNKRALLVMPVMIFLFIYIFVREKNKMLKILKFLIPSIIGLMILINVFPVMGNVFYRFINDDDNHRSELHAVCIEMNQKKPIFGYGINSYNTYAYDSGFRLHVFGTDDSNIWKYHAHNIYYQLLGETGYIGLVLIILTFTFYIYQSIVLLRQTTRPESKRILFFSTYIQLLFVLYGYTGNTFYYYQQIAIYFIAISFLITEIKQKNKL